jgi:putative restriction endonuclease
MGIDDLTDRNAVMAAVTEFKALGRDDFLEKYGFGRARKYCLELDGERFDSKAIVGAALAYQFPGRRLTARDFRGGEATVARKLRSLGFVVVGAGSSLRVFGPIPGVQVGAWFENRAALNQAGVHRPTQAGISGTASEGAESIVVSGGYVDDQDFGDEIIYTGQGGQENGRQVRDQEFVLGNAALARSCNEGLPVRVIRGVGAKTAHSPERGYRYDGLFRVERYWPERGRSGFRIWRFRLVKADDATVDGQGPTAAPLPRGADEPKRKPSTVQRIVRNSEVAQWVKDENGHVCQICGGTVETPTGLYAEGAHIRPLGRPHSGPDTPENVLCLCPNCHVRFDAGALVITDQFEVIDLMENRPVGVLRSAATHYVDSGHLKYHRDMFEMGFGPEVQG